MPILGDGYPESPQGLVDAAMFMSAGRYGDTLQGPNQTFELDCSLLGTGFPDQSLIAVLTLLQHSLHIG